MAAQGPEVHPGTDIEIPSGVPSSAFRVKIPNPERYMKLNSVSLEDVIVACQYGDYDELKVMLESGKAMQLFNGDLNQHYAGWTPLHFAAATGNTECAQLLLKAGADPHMKEGVSHSQDPESRRTAQQCAQSSGWLDTVDVLKKAESATPFGCYVPAGPEANKKIYGAWEWKKSPPKGWYFKRPFAAVGQGLAPAAFGVADPPPPPPASSSRARPKSCGLLFGGITTCRSGLLSDCKETVAVKAILQKASKALGFDVSACCEENLEAMQKNGRGAMAVFVAGLAGLQQLKFINPSNATQPAAVCGMDVGQYVALCAAGVLSIEDALPLVKKRCEAVAADQASKPFVQVTVAALKEETVLGLCKEAAASESRGCCELSGKFFPKGLGVAGTAKAMEKFQALAKEKGGKVKLLKETSSCVGTSMLAAAQKKLSQAIDEALPKMNPPKCLLFLNPLAEPLPPGSSPKLVADALKTELVTPMQLQKALESMLAGNVKQFYEVGAQPLIKSFLKLLKPELANAVEVVQV